MPRTLAGLPAASSASISSTSGQQLAGAGRERPPRVGQLEPPPGPAEQRHAALALELGELLGHGGRRERERVGGARDRALGGELAQDGQAARIEHQLKYR